MKKNYLMKLMLSCIFLMSAIIASAQTGSVSGRVMDETNQPLPGATVSLKGTGFSAATDLNGFFKLNNVKPGTATLLVKFIGYQNSEKTVSIGTSNLTVDFKLVPSFESLSEVVVVGYGTQRKQDLTGAVIAVTEKDFNKGNIVTVDQLISGKVAGVQITSGGGAPGAGSTIRIRGGASLNASNDPLIVIDGVPVDNAELKGSANALSFINPNDIESFNILKDASATAIYGSRASNGVIIIVTKKGKAGESFKVDFSTLGSLSRKANEVPVLSPDQFRSVVKAQGSAAQQALLGTANTNWQDLIYRDAYSSDNNLSFSGSLKQMPYRLSLGYLNQQGILQTDKLDRTSAALNLSPKFLNDNLSINLNLKGGITNSHFADQGAIGQAVSFDPTQPIYASNPTLGGYFEWMDPANPGKPWTLANKNPISTLNQTNNNGKVKRSIGNIQFDYKMPFVSGLRANLNLGYDYSESNGSSITPNTLASAFFNGGSISKYSQQKSNKLADFYLNYVKELKNINSRIDVTGGYSYQDFMRESPDYPTINGNGNVTTGKPFKTQNTLISVFGRVNYGYLDKYLLTATVRRDGSSRFNPDNRWGTFPSVALAWRINQESFLKDSKTLSDLKLRLGYGITGQQDISNNDYPYLARYTYSGASAQYQFGNTFYNTLRPEGYDANIKWEQTSTSNAGLDFGFLNGKITGSADYYIKKTKDLLSFIPVPAGSNLTNGLLTNVGSIENKGLELVLNYNAISKKDLTWSFGFNGTLNQSKITNLSKTQDPTQVVEVGGIGGGVGNNIQLHKVGESPYSFFVYKQVYNSAGNPIEGLYEDLNKDGVVDAKDKYLYKSPASPVFLGFNTQVTYKNWSLGTVLRASVGNYVYNNTASNTGNYRAFSFPNYLNNVNSSVLATNFTGIQLWSDYYMENASYLKMDNLNLGYNFKQVLNKRMNLRLTANVQNVFTVTKYSGLDPEIGGGIDNNFYPRPRIYSMGLNLNF